MILRRPLWMSLLMYATLGLTSAIILYPLLFMLLATFTTPEQYLRTAFFPIPNSLSFHNYVTVISDCSQGCIWQAIIVTAVRCAWPHTSIRPIIIFICSASPC